MKINIDLAKEGLNHFFKLYEILGWDVVWNAPEPIGSGEVFRKVLKALGPDRSISRTSIIYFLNRQVGLGFMGCETRTGLGGHHLAYYAKVTMYGLVDAIYQTTSRALLTLIKQAEEYDKMNREGPGMVYQAGMAHG